MFLSKHSNGYYYVYYTQSNGKRNSTSTKTKIKSEAIKFLTEFRTELEKRKVQRLADILFSNYSNNFLTFSQLHHTEKTYKAYKGSIKKFNSFIGDLYLKEITHKKVNEYFENRIKTSSIFQARKDLICLKGLFNKAVNESLILVNPCKEIKRFRIPEKQPLFFGEIEFEILLKKIENKDIKDIVLFAVQTGLRQMEIINLTWNQINFKEGYLILDNRNHLTKSKKIRTIPLSLKALQVLTDRQISSKTELIFTYKGKKTKPNYLSKRFKNYVIDAGLNNKLNFHSLRHSFASWLVQKGVSIYEVSKLLGHSDIKVTEIYAHLKPENLRNAVELLK